MRVRLALSCVLLGSACPNPACPEGLRFEHGACVPDPNAGGDADTDADTDSDTDTDADTDTDTGTLRTTPWDGPMMVRADVQRTGVYPGPGPSKGVVKWTAAIGPSCDAPVISDGSVYVATLSGVVEALDVGTGIPRWSYTAGALYLAGPAVADDRVVVGDRLGVVHALAVSTGIRSWQHTGSSSCSAPVIDGDEVWVACGELSVLDAASGKELRSTAITNPESDQAPTLTSELAVVGGGPLQGFERDSLVERWATSLPSTASTAATDDIFVWLSSASGTFAVGTNQGAVEWQTDVFSSVEASSPALAQGVIYAGTTRAVRAREAASGVELWSAQLPARPTAGIVVAGGGVYVNDEEGTIHALNRSDGALMWSLPVEACGSPAVADGVLYVGVMDGLVAIE